MTTEYSMRQIESMPTSLARISAQIEKLERQAEALRGGAVQKVRKLMAELGVTLDDLNGSGSSASNRRGGAAGKPSVGKAKYRDPATGKTWTGHGRAPEWIKNASDRSVFLINSTAEASEKAGPLPAKRRRSRKTPAKSK